VLLPELILAVGGAKSAFINVSIPRVITIAFAQASIAAIKKILPKIRSLLKNLKLAETLWRASVLNRLYFVNEISLH
jgi:hypothetical protein